MEALQVASEGVRDGHGSLIFFTAWFPSLLGFTRVIKKISVIVRGHGWEYASIVLKCNQERHK